MNNISIIGRLTKDINLTHTPNGTPLARFNVAVPSEFKDENGERKADFFVCIAWRDTAETLAKYVKKGHQIGLCGSMNSRTYESPEKGPQQIWELNVKSFSFVASYDEEGKTTSQENKGSKKSNKSNTAKQSSMKFEEIDPDDDDNLPF